MTRSRDRVTVRGAREADYDSLCRLWAEVDSLHARLVPGFFRKGPGAARPRRRLVEILARRDEVLLVAESERDIAGLAHVRVFDTPADPLKVQRRRGHVEDIVVAAEHRRRGVGRALMAAASEWCRGRGASQLLLTVWTGNEAAEEFYASLGYRPVSHVLGLDLD